MTSWQASLLLVHPPAQDPSLGGKRCSRLASWWVEPSNCKRPRGCVLPRDKNLLDIGGLNQPYCLRDSCSSNTHTSSKENCHRPWQLWSRSDEKAYQNPIPCFARATKRRFSWLSCKQMAFVVASARSQMSDTCGCASKRGTHRSLPFIPRIID